jgi:hypothetical protein
VGAARAFRETVSLPLLLLGPFQNLVEFALAGGRGIKQGQKLWITDKVVAVLGIEGTRTLIICLDKLKTVQFDLPEKLNSFYEATILGLG